MSPITQHSPTDPLPPDCALHTFFTDTLGVFQFDQRLTILPDAHSIRAREVQIREKLPLLDPQRLAIRNDFATRFPEVFAAFDKVGCAPFQHLSTEGTAAEAPYSYLGRQVVCSAFALDEWCTAIQRTTSQALSESERATIVESGLVLKLTKRFEIERRQLGVPSGLADSSEVHRSDRLRLLELGVDERIADLAYQVVCHSNGLEGIFSLVGVNASGALELRGEFAMQMIRAADDITLGLRPRSGTSDLPALVYVQPWEKVWHVSQRDPVGTFQRWIGKRTVASSFELVALDTDSDTPECSVLCTCGQMQDFISTQTLQRIARLIDPTLSQSQEPCQSMIELLHVSAGS